MPFIEVSLPPPPDSVFRSFRIFRGSSSRSSFTTTTAKETKYTKTAPLEIQSNTTLGYAHSMASLEREIHQWLRQQFSDSVHPDVLIGIGDDAAVTRGADRPLVITTDTIADGTHFLSRQHPLDLIGRKSLAVNLSDIAAMGAKPKSVVLHWMLPRSFSLDQVKTLFQGVKKLADHHDIQIIGGDTNCWDGPLVIGATALGELDSLDAAWRIDTASPGDAIFVSGRFGGSILGHHLSFEPAVELAMHLVERGVVNAATDVSDSLTRDLHAMAKSSNCGAEISIDQIPIADAAFERASGSVEDPTDAASVKKRALHHAMTDGEDFGLILAVPSDKVAALEDAKPSGSQLTRIGSFVQGDGLWSRQPDGALESIKPQGYDH